MERSRLRQGAAPLRRWQDHPRRSGWNAGPLQSESREVRSVVESPGARKHRMDAADAGGHAALRSRPQDHRGLRSGTVAAFRFRPASLKPRVAVWHDGEGPNEIHCPLHYHLYLPRCSKCSDEASAAIRIEGGIASVLEVDQSWSHAREGG